jgi:hypothetical protein
MDHNVESPYTLEIYTGMVVGCKKISDNPGAIRADHEYIGAATYFPQVGLRFRAGTLDTNIIAKLVEDSEEGGKFMTISGSIYQWRVITHGDPEEVVTLKGAQMELIKQFLEDNKDA